MKQFSKDLGNVSLAPRGKWSREQEYERLALVYNTCDNLSYVAKINVPSGVDIENREYWQPMNATGYADNNFINLTAENENGTITAYESLEEAVATILPINRRAGATLSFYNLNSDRLDRQAEFELWQFNSTDLANWENRDYWNNIYYNWNVFAGWYVGADGLKNHVKLPTVGQYAYVGSNLNDAVLYQCRTNGIWTNTGIKVRNYISVIVSGNITIGENGNWYSDGKDTGIPATPSVDEQLDNIIIQLQQHATEIDELQKQDVVLKSNIDSNFETINNKVDNIKTATDNKIDTADANLQNQITSNDTDITTLNTKHESLSKTVQGIAATGGASTATNVTYNNDASELNAENAQDAIDELQSSKFDKTSILQELGNAEDKVMSQKAVSTIFSGLSNILNTNAVYGGIVNPESKAPTPVSPIFYIAYKAGTYTNFGGVTITCLSTITWENNKWNVEPILDILSNMGRKGVNSTPLTLSEVISSIPESERVAGKLVTFRNSDNYNKHALAIFNSDAFKSGWTNEDNWVVIDFSDLNNVINKPITEEKIAKETIDSFKGYNNTKTNLDATTLQDAIDKILTSHYAGGIVNVNARYADSATKTYTLEEAIACIPEYEHKSLKGLLYNKTGTKKPTLAFYLNNSRSNFTDTSYWIEIDLSTSKSVFNAYQSATYGSNLNAMLLAEAIELVPEGERHPGKIVVFKSPKSWSLALFNSDSYLSGWTNEDNWAVVDAPNLKLISSIKQTLDDISALKSNVNQLNEGLTGKVDKIQGKVLSTNDYTNEDKEKLDAISIPTIPNSVIKNAVDTYIEENNADLSLKDKTLNVITNYTYKLNENVLGAPVSIGTNWSGDIESGFTHTAGSEEALEFDISAIPLNSKILVRFDATNLNESADIFVSVGDLPKIKSYNGTTSFKAGVIYTGGTLKFIPTEQYAGTISNIKCQVISNNGTELFEDRQDVVYNTRKDFVYGFWNVFMGGTETAKNAQDITRSIAIGNYALKDMLVGNRNIAIGTFALPEVVEGEDNVAIGADTIYPLVKANNCVGIGKGTLGGSKAADSCVAVGGGAMGVWSSDYDRINCVAIGVNAGIPIAENCTHVGYRAGANVVGKNNTSIGYNSMCYGASQGYGVTGENLVCVGYKAEIANTPEAKSAVNSMALGANTTITKSNQVVIGNSAVDEVLIAGKKIIFYEDGTVKWENIT